MIRSKFAKAFILGMCITVFSTTAILAADTGGGQSDAFQGQQADIMTTAAGSPGSIAPSSTLSEEIRKKQSEIDKYPDGSVSSPIMDIPDVNKDVLQKQSEIDQYLFEQHKDEIAEKGFMVTHTSPTYNYVEIGITPYNEANAEFLYKLFGKDMVKVVEGQQATLMTAAAGAADIAVANPEADNKILSAQNDKAELYTTTSVAKDSRESSGMSLPLLITLVVAGAVIALGGTVFVIHRRKVAVK